MLPTAGLGERQAQKILKLLGVTFDYELKFQGNAKKLLLKLIKS